MSGGVAGAGPRGLITGAAPMPIGTRAGAGAALSVHRHTGDAPTVVSIAHCVGVRLVRGEIGRSESERRVRAFARDRKSVV